MGTLAGNATFAKPIKDAGDRKMRRKNWMTSGSCSIEEEKDVNGRAEHMQTWAESLPKKFRIQIQN